MDFTHFTSCLCWVIHGWYICGEIFSGRSRMENFLEKRCFELRDSFLWGYFRSISQFVFFFPVPDQQVGRSSSSGHSPPILYWTTIFAVLNTYPYSKLIWKICQICRSFSGNHGSSIFMFVLRPRSLVFSAWPPYRWCWSWEGHLAGGAVIHGIWHAMRSSLNWSVSFLKYQYLEIIYIYILIYYRISPTISESISTSTSTSLSLSLYNISNDIPYTSIYVCTYTYLT